MPSKFMHNKPPAAIEDMQTLYYAGLDGYEAYLKKYMPLVPKRFVLVYWPEDKSYCILGTDENFSNWERYVNYAFKELQPALEFTDTILRLPDDFRWIKT